MSDSSEFRLFSSDIVEDIFLWRRKKITLSVLLVSTSTWVLLDVYEFNFITVVSWIAMVLVSSLFIYGNLVRLLGKEEPKFSGLEVSEEKVIQTANSVKEMTEGVIQWMLCLSIQRDLFIFAKVAAFLFLFSYVGSFFDFTTFAYIGIMVGMSVPVIYKKNEDRRKRCGEWVKMQGRRFYEIVDEKVLKKVKDRVSKVSKVEEREKEKKLE